MRRRQAAAGAGAVCCCAMVPRRRQVGYTTCSSQPLGSPICSSRKPASSSSGCSAEAGRGEGAHLQACAQGSRPVGRAWREQTSPRNAPQAAPAAPQAAHLARPRRGGGAEEQHAATASIQLHHLFPRPSRVAWPLGGAGVEGGVQALVCRAAAGVREGRWGEAGRQRGAGGDSRSMQPAPHPRRCHVHTACRRRGSGRSGSGAGPRLGTSE